MKICVDARSPGYSGIYNYTRRLMPALIEAAPEHEWVMLRTKADKPWPIEGAAEIVIPTANPLGWLLWSNTRLPALLRSERFDVYHTHKHITAFRGDTPKVISFHGARFYMQPETYGFAEYAYWRTMAPLAARSYEASIVVSDVDKENFVRHTRTDPDRFTVVPLGSDERFRHVTDRDLLDETRAKYDLPDRFLVFVGRMLPVKNLETLIRAFAAACARGIPHDLVMVGRETQHSESLKSLARGLGIDLRMHWKGPIFEDIALVINLADALYLGSTYEAFATVALESVACGTPVIGSDRGNIPFIVGEAGRCVPAFDVDAFTDAIVEVLDSEGRHETLSRKGVERAAEFSWEKCARGTLDVLERVVRSRG